MHNGECEQLPQQADVGLDDGRRRSNAAGCALDDMWLREAAIENMRALVACGGKSLQ
jgi:hypothetical protein